MRHFPSLVPCRSLLTRAVSLQRFGSGAHQFVANLQEQVAQTESQMILEKADLSKLSDEVFGFNSRAR